MPCPRRTPNAAERFHGAMRANVGGGDNTQLSHLAPGRHRPPALAYLWGVGSRC